MYRENNKGKAFLYSILVYITLCLACLFCYISLPYAKEEVNMGGVEVNIGNSDQGMGDDISSAEPPAASAKASKQQQNTEPVKADQPEKMKVAVQAEKEPVTQELEDVASLHTTKKPKKLPIKDREETSLHTEKKPKKLAAEEDTKKAKPHAEKLNVNALYKGSQSNGTGGGDGNTGQAGNQGKPNGSALSRSYSGDGIGGGGVALNLTGRKFLSRPSLSDDGQSEGRIAVDITVDKGGNITIAKAGARGTTIQNAALWRKCEDAVKQAKLNSITDGPEIQSGRVVFSFKLQ